MDFKISQTDILRTLMNEKDFIPIPSCFDALSAKLIEQAKFDVTFMSGFAVSASRIGSPDLGPVSYTHLTLPTNREV